MPTTYRVALEVFEGPLDLLLRLIERRELDINQVSLALVADQYLEHIAMLHELAASNLAEFLVIAAKLLVIKSRSLLPPDEETQGEEEEEDVGADLAQQLAEYKRFKHVAGKLRTIEETGLRAFARVAPPPQVQKRVPPGEVSLTDLLQAFRRALAIHPPVPPVDSVVAPVVLHISDTMRTIQALLHEHTPLPFSTLLQRARSRLEVIVNFLAVLELIKQQRLRALQEQLFGEIYLEPREPDPDAQIEPTEPDAYGEEDSS